MNSKQLIPTLISLLRIPLLLLFLSHNPLWRISACVLASITDILDGFLARKWHAVSRFGTIIDPLTDKVFVFCILAIFFYEGRVNEWELFSFLCRDISLLLFTGYLIAIRRWSSYRIRSFICGKITTALQFLVLALLSLDQPVPAILFYAMAIFGLSSLAELLQRSKVLLNSPSITKE